MFGENIKGILENSKYEAIADLVNIDEDVFKDKYGENNKDQFINDYISKFFNT